MPKKERQVLRWKNLKWSFQDDAQAELIANAMLGQSNRAIMRDLEFTENEVNYALTKAKRLYALKSSIRSGWRDGTNDVARQVKRDLIAVLRQDVQAQLPKLIVHPTPKTVKVAA
jgi:hypothetical protein